MRIGSGNNGSDLSFRIGNLNSLLRELPARPAKFGRWFGKSADSRLHGTEDSENLGCVEDGGESPSSCAGSSGILGDDVEVFRMSNDDVPLDFLSSSSAAGVEALLFLDLKENC